MSRNPRTRELGDRLRGVFSAGGVVQVWFGLVLAAGIGLMPAAAATNPTQDAAVRQAIERGRAFLIRRQNPDGSWGSARRTKDLNIFAPVPGAHDAFRSGTSALAVAALIETEPGKGDEAGRTSRERGEAWLLEHLPQLRRADGVALYNVWGHAYGIQALAAMHRRAKGDPTRQQRIVEVMRGQIDLLGRYEAVAGGWGYYDFDVGAKQPAADSTSFVSATVLVAFHAAREVGVPIPERLWRRAVASIERQRKPDNTYVYAEPWKYRPMGGINRAAGSLGRSQACNLALKLWGEETLTPAVFSEWLDRLATRNGWLSIGRKRPVPHESWFQVAGYFFYYGHYYAARGLEFALPEKRAQHQTQLTQILLPLQEKDGSWWDYPLYDYHQPYGTAYALMTLHRCLSPTVP